MTSNRIWIDLSSFFSGVRQQSCIIVDHEKLKTVKDVEDHISRVFEIDSPFFILNDGWLLPSSESSLLFRDNDTVRYVTLCVHLEVALTLNITWESTNYVLLSFSFL